MSAEVLREAAALMRTRATMATGGQPVRDKFTPWTVVGNHRPGVAFVNVSQVRIAQTDERIGQDDFNAQHIASWHPAVALAAAAWLDRAAEEHRSESVDDLYLWDCTECPEGCEGHTRDCCWGCHTLSEDGYAGRVFYPCGEMKVALAVAVAYLGSDQ